MAYEYDMQEYARGYVDALKDKPMPLQNEQTRMYMFGFEECLEDWYCAEIGLYIPEQFPEGLDE